MLLLFRVLFAQKPEAADGRMKLVIRQLRLPGSPDATEAGSIAARYLIRTTQDYSEHIAVPH
jgi:hypothetical protein